MALRKIVSSSVNIMTYHLDDHEDIHMAELVLAAFDGHKLEMVGRDNIINRTPNIVEHRIEVDLKSIELLRDLLDDVENALLSLEK